ncbi:hypothetical protein [Leucobacter sp. cx-169]|uniref:hypothetical protein n=1 Tax=Leucobacter sp. cx-169 TaxID=2770549 RepID=UPI00165DA4C5|nr:hypothetical protein [Leucobacter sp. cx-169]MBC9927353.1 hypothetical protein [Leucobacter sp. cx-169]
MSEKNRQLAGAVKAGANVGGQWASQERPEAAAPPPSGLADVLTTLSPNARERLNDGNYEPGDMDELYAVVGYRLRAGVDPCPNLYPVADDEHLNDVQVELLLAGDPGVHIQDQLEGQLDERRTTVERAITEELMTANGVNFRSLADTDRAGMIEMIGDYNSADIVGDMAANTPPQVMRAKVGAPMYDAMPDWCAEQGKSFYDDLYGGIASDLNDRWPAIHRNRESFLEAQLQASGYELSATDRDSIRALVAGGPEDWHNDIEFDVVWEGDIGNASVPQHYPQRGTLTLGSGDTGPTLVLMDPYSGKSAVARLERPLNVSVSPGVSAFLNDSPSAPVGFKPLEIDDELRKRLSIPTTVVQQTD